MDKIFIVQPYPNEHACRVNEPTKYERFARKEFEHEGKKYYAIIGFSKTVAVKCRHIDTRKIFGLRHKLQSTAKSMMENI